MKRKIYKVLSVMLLFVMVIIMIPTQQIEAKTNWKKLYKAWLDKNLSDWGTGYQLVYVNDDSIPELFIFQGEISGIYLTASKDKVSVVYGTGLVLYGKNKVCAYRCGGGVESNSYYKIKNGEWYQIEEGYYDGIGTDNPICYWVTDKYKNKKVKNGFVENVKYKKINSKKYFALKNKKGKNMKVIEFNLTYNQLEKKLK